MLLIRMQVVILMLIFLWITINAQLTIKINGEQLGRQYWGVGAVSGGGGTTRLLVCIFLIF